MNMTRFLIFAFLIFLLACSSSIKRTDDIENHKLILNTSHKSDVVNAIGLPKVVQDNQVDNTEMWFYTGNPDTSGLIIPVITDVDHAHHYTIITATTKELSVKNTTPTTLVCIFNKSGLLIGLYRPGESK